MTQVALITGGSRGIGLGIARCLAAAKYDLVICGVRARDQVEVTLNELGSLGVEVLYCQADVSNRDDRARGGQAGARSGDARDRFRARPGQARDPA